MEIYDAWVQIDGMDMTALQGILTHEFVYEKKVGSCAVDRWPILFSNDSLNMLHSSVEQEEHKYQL